MRHGQHIAVHREASAIGVAWKEEAELRAVVGRPFAVPQQANTHGETACMIMTEKDAEIYAATVFLDS